MIDEVKTISDLAHTFFFELGRKANTIYNILPDTISQLSTAAMAARMGETGFKTIMSYLFSFVAKDKHQESLVVKLCQRLQGCDALNARNFAFCLSLLSYSGRSLGKLMEHHKAYHDKLFDPQVEASFRSISSRTKRTAKDMVVRFDALVDKLLAGETDVESLVPGLTPADVIARDQENAAKASKKAARAKARKVAAKKERARRSRRAMTDDDDYTPLAECQV